MSRFARLISSLLEKRVLLAGAVLTATLSASPEALAQVEDLLAVMANETITDVEKDHPFVECAQFADAIKYKGGGW